MRRIIKTGIEARIELAKGAKFLADAVKSTSGPFGLNAFLDKHDKITNDGISIANEIQLVDEVQNRGAKAIREAGKKTDEKVGDGTTSAITLAYEIYNAASKLLPEKGVAGKLPPSEVIKQIEAERKEVTEKLIASATKIETREQLIDSATVSAEDRTLGELIGGTQWDLGVHGRILVEESNNPDCSIERVKGIKIDNGFGTSQVINNFEKQLLEIKDTSVLLTSHTIKTGQDWEGIIKVADAAQKNNHIQMTVIARAWTDEAIQACVRNNNRAGAFKIWPLSAPYINMQERMKDLQAVLGGMFYDSENSTMEDMDATGLGFAHSITANRYEATIAGNDDEITALRVETRVKELKDMTKGSESTFEKKMLGERIAQLENGFALLKVGSVSDMERERIMDKCIDAVNASLAALEEGTVKGAGLAFKEIADSLPDTYILKNPLQAVYKEIMSSAPKGFVIEDWVRDPVKVQRIALEQACIAAASLATAAIIITAETTKPLDEIFRKSVDNSQN